MPLCYYSLLSLLIFFLTELQYSAVSIQEVLHQDIILSICLFQAYFNRSSLLIQNFPMQPIFCKLDSETPGNYPKQEASVPATLIW